jgi:hypothetical protein
MPISSDQTTSTNIPDHKSSEVLTVVSGVQFRRVEATPLAFDLDVATKLGFSRPAKFRDLIKRWEPSLGEVFTTEGKTSNRGGRPGKDYWLTEEQVLFLVAKSDTPKAIEITKEMIRIFVLVKNGGAQAVPQGVTEKRVGEMITDALAPLTNAVMSLANRLGFAFDQGPFIGAAAAEEHILEPLRRYAEMKAWSMDIPPESTRVRRKLRFLAEKRVRKAVDFGIDAQASWKRLPASKLPLAIATMQQMLHEIRCELTMQQKPVSSTDSLPLMRYAAQQMRRAN